MIGKLNLLTLVTLLPATAMAADLQTSHIVASVPGKTVHAYRPLAQKSAPVAKCHPDATKAVACEAQASLARQEALATRRASTTEQLSAR